MKKLLSVLAAIILAATSCKKEPPAAPVDTSTAADYYTVQNRTVVNMGSMFSATLAITVSNAEKISSMVIKRASNYSLLPDFNLKMENTTQTNVFTDRLNIFTGFVFEVYINLKSGKNIKTFFIF